MPSLMLEYSFLSARPIKSSMTERLADVLRTEAENDPHFRRLSVFSRNLPSWASDELDFWRTDDHWELGCKGREITIGFSDPLPAGRHEELFRTFAAGLLDSSYAYTAVIRRRTAARWSRIGYDRRIIRAPFESGHLLFCERKIEPDREEPSRESYFCRPRKDKGGQLSGGYRKDTRWSQSYNREWVLRARLFWCRLVNAALEQEGYDGRLGMNTYGTIYPVRNTDRTGMFVPKPILVES